MGEWLVGNHVGGRLVSQQWEGDFETSEAAKNRLWVGIPPPFFGEKTNRLCFPTLQKCHINWCN